MGMTDIDEKIVARARALGVDASSVARRYEVWLPSGPEPRASSPPTLRKFRACVRVDLHVVLLALLRVFCRMLVRCVSPCSLN